MESVSLNDDEDEDGDEDDEDEDNEKDSNKRDILILPSATGDDDGNSALLSIRNMLAAGQSQISPASSPVIPATIGSRRGLKTFRTRPFKSTRLRAVPVSSRSFTSAQLAGIPGLRAVPVSSRSFTSAHLTGIPGSCMFQRLVIYVINKLYQ